MSKGVSYHQRAGAFGAFEVHIPMGKNPVFLGFYAVWLAGWLFVGAMVFVHTFVHEHHPVGEGLVFFAGRSIGWIVCFLWLCYAWLWNAFGREIISVHIGEFSLQRDLFGRGPTKSFPLDRISHIRTTGFSTTCWSFIYRMVGLGLVGGNIAFDYKGKTHRFGIWLKENEARDLVDRLRPYLPEGAFAQPS